MPVEITEIFYPKARPEWRQWLETHHTTKTEIWLRRFKKAASKPCITYDELVEECLCFGWIDGVVKKLDKESNVQRITPRRKKKTFLSELNRQRVWKLQREGLMTPAGIAPIEDQIGSPDDPWDIPDWVEAQLREDDEVWANFQAFPKLYRRLKIGWIKECGERRREEAQKRLNWLIKNTKKGKRYGTVPIEG
ncbi:MAG: YdeI/OmpD-associated family protein [Phaeodactylibacter sp.]|uniref:YdeI/OmpD-associated family protein n=1 Tax=Phaeodactylibacter sp. TaxID=1940289 RepID=UPI0032EE4828